MHLQNCVLTLTYDDCHMPEGHSLRKRDVQLFLKKLRRSIAPQKISYFYCGEYGEQLSRPHYHMILFGYWPDDVRPYKKARDGSQLYVSAKTSDLWGQGFVTVGSVSPSTAGYVTAYIFKKVRGSHAENHYKRYDPETGEVFDLQPEFINMSTRPAIGKEWFNRYAADAVTHDYIIHNSSKTRVPKYYDKLHKRADREALEATKAARVKKSITPRNIRNNRPDRLAVRERVLKAKVGLYKRNLE